MKEPRSSTEPAARPSDWLLDERRDVYSQFGEDGVLAAILDVLGPAGEPSWCVELGAYDGVLWSNTRHLVESRGFRAVLIEPNPRRFRKLTENYRGVEGVVLQRRFVTLEADGGLDAILAEVGLPEAFDVLSIDVDGNDYHLWRSVVRHRPRVVVVEFNPTIHAHLDVVQPPDRPHVCGASLLALSRLGAEKGYELVAATDANAFFVRRADFPRFGIADNRPEVLWRRLAPRYLTYLYQHFDGSLVLAGNDRLVWHRMRIRPGRIQMLPRFLRFYPGLDNAWLRLVKRLYYLLVPGAERPPVL